MRTALAYLLAGIGLSAIAFLLGNYETDLYRKMLLWVCLALSYNYLFGVCGQVAFAHFTFYGVGAYSIVILTFQAGLPLPLAAVLGLVLCAAVALVVAIPSTRLEAFYLALATLALAQLFQVVLTEGGELTGGQGGLGSYFLPPVFGFEIRGPTYTIIIVAVLLFTLALLQRLDRSWFGRACRAVRDNPEAASAAGIDVARVKVLAFTLTSTLAGLAGMAYAFVDNTVNPPIFGLQNMFLLLFMVIIGGSGNMAGAILGAVALYLAPFLLEPIVGRYHPLVFGTLMVVVILFHSTGLIGLVHDGWARLRPGREPAR